MAPALNFPPELLLKAQGRGRGIRAAIFDVDGVLTDGRLFVGEHGELFKSFHVLDGHGIKLLARGGIEPVVISGRDSPALHRRMADLGVSRVAFGAADKLASAEAIRRDMSLSWDDIAVIGDDWPDLPLLQRAGFACAVANAHAEVKAVAQYVTALQGGRGGAREFCDLLLTASGRYAELLQAGRLSLDIR